MRLNLVAAHQINSKHWMTKQVNMQICQKFNENIYSLEEKKIEQIEKTPRFVC